MTGALLVSGCAQTPARTGSYTDSYSSRSSIETPARLRVLHTASAMLGAPYRYGGANPRGFDCSGLVYFSYRQAGLELPRTARDQFAYSQPIKLQHLQPGDLVFFKLTGAKASHVGIYAGNGEFIHAPSSGKTVSRSSLDNPYWRRHLVGAGSYL